MGILHLKADTRRVGWNLKPVASVLVETGLVPATTAAEIVAFSICVKVVKRDVMDVQDGQGVSFWC